jgi:hypothetical protein
MLLITRVNVVYIPSETELEVAPQRICSAVQKEFMNVLSHYCQAPGKSGDHNLALTGTKTS